MILYLSASGNRTVTEIRSGMGCGNRLGMEALVVLSVGKKMEMKRIGLR